MNYHLELLKTSRYVNLSRTANSFIITTTGFTFPVGTIIPICINGLKISEAKVISETMLTNDIRIYINNLEDGLVPELSLVDTPYTDIGYVDKNIINSNVVDMLDYSSLKYILLNVKFKR